MKKGIVICCFGDRCTQLQGLLRNIRKYSALPIDVYTNKNIYDFIVKNYENVQILEVDSSDWENHPRWGIRQGNLWHAKSIIYGNFDCSLCLDDDMRIVNSNFIEGFALAETFGVCLPMNPRIYTKYNAMGEDVDNKDIIEIEQYPQYSTACNMSPIFAYRKNVNCVSLISKYIEELQNKTCRGTLALWKASWKTKIAPLYLPEQWCVCGSNAEYIKNYHKELHGKMINIEPIILHWGHAKVRQIFKDVIDE